MTQEKKVLLLSASVGSGHTRAAQAVGKAMEHADSTVQTKIVNMFQFMEPHCSSLILTVYLKIIRLCPGLYGMMYRWGNSSRLALWGRRRFSRRLALKMLPLIDAYHPSLIVCTHASPAGAVAYLAANGALKVPSAAVITDFVVHRLWVYSALDHYFVANESMRQFLEKTGVDPSKTTVSGIPIDSTFRKEHSSLAANQILIMGGGAGVLPMHKIVAALDLLPADFRMVVITGNNRSMQQRLTRALPHFRHTVEILGYVTNVDAWMAKSTLLISKAGGMTSAESLASGLPMVIFHPIPGQEEANTRYLTNSGVAVRANSVADVIRITTELLKSPAQLNAMRAAARREGKPDAADFIARRLLALL